MGNEAAATAIVAVKPEAQHPQTTRGILTLEILKAEAEQRQLLKKFIKEQMVENTDFGIIPGTDKPTLLKPGAEKLVDLFRVTPSFEIIKEVEDYDKNLFAYTFRVQLFQRDASVILAEGFGSANSREGRYRWRHATKKCPTCSKETIIKGKDEYGGGWLCFAKKGGCGAKFLDKDPAITGQSQGKVENDDVATLANTILKMAKKRALVDGAIALARVSDMFTQDVEDIEDDLSPDAEEHAPALVEEFRQALLAENDAKKLWRLTEKITDAFERRRLNTGHKNELAALYKKRAAEIGHGGTK